MSYKISEAARKDLIRIHQYGVRQFGEALADKYYYGFFDQFDKIESNPKHYPLVPHIRENYRRCVYGVGSIYYRVVNDIVEIMAIIGRQDLDELLQT